MPLEALIYTGSSMSEALWRCTPDGRETDRGAALTSTLHWFETELLTQEENLIGLMALNRETLGQAECLDSSSRVVLDMDSSESPVHGRRSARCASRRFKLEIPVRIAFTLWMRSGHEANWN